MTLREFLTERSFEDEMKDSKHPIQKNIEEKFTKLLYDNIMKQKLTGFEDKYHILDKSYDDVVELLKGKEFLGDKYGFNEAELTLDRNGNANIKVYCSWNTDDVEDKDRYHTRNSGDAWEVTLRKDSWDKDKETYRKFLNGDIDTIIKSKVGVGRWNLYRGQTFWIGDKGFKLTDDYKIVDATDDDFKNYHEYSARQIADWLWRNTSPALAKIREDAMKKFDTSRELADWIEKHPDKKTKLNEIMSHKTQMGKRRY